MEIPRLYNFKNKKLIYDLYKVSKKLGTTSFEPQQYALYGKYLPELIIYKFDTWQKALDQIRNLNFTQKSTYITTEDLFDNLRNLCEALGRKPLRTEIKKPFSKYNFHTYYVRLGTYKRVFELYNAHFLATLNLCNESTKSDT